MANKHKGQLRPPEPVAGNGLLDRRALLGRGMLFASAAAHRRRRFAHLRRRRAAAGRSLEHGARRADPALWHAGEVREQGGAHAHQPQPRAAHQPGPHAAPSAERHDHAGGLHFVVSRTGFPDIDPAKHRLAIHGLVKQPLVFDLDALARYPMVSRIHFVECGGNSAPLFSKDPVQANVQAIHGLLSCSEWTGVRLSTLLDETGIDPKAKWLIAEGADGPSMNRSIPIAKALDDAMIALYQNGERIAPAQGYPMRLLVPGYEGNMNVKWLHRIKLVEEPVMAINETLQYTYRVAGAEDLAVLLPDGSQDPSSPIPRRG